jgi:VWFA-related protein
MGVPAPADEADVWPRKDREMATSITRRELMSGAMALVAGRVWLRAQGQATAQAPVFTSDVDVVSLYVTVRDKQGALVRDLGRDAFSVREDGRQQALSFFSRESDLPLTIGILVDRTASESNMLAFERQASLAFLEHMLRPDRDKAFVVQYRGSTPELLQGLTSSRDELQAGLDRLLVRDAGEDAPAAARPQERDRWGNPRGDSRFGGRGGPSYAAALANAIRFASRDILSKQQGRKALLILGDGDHLNDEADEVIGASQRADTAIYAIRIYDDDFGKGRRGPGGEPGGINIGPVKIGVVGGQMGRGGPGGAMGPGGPGGMAPRGPENGEKNLKKLARETGGAYFEVDEKHSLESIYLQIEEELRSQYLLGYTPDAKAGEGFRAIKVDVSGKDLTVRCRKGYFGRGRRR